MKAYRGYEIGKGWCSNVGVFIDGYQNYACDTEAEAMAEIDRWIAEWKEKVATAHPEAEACRAALEACGEA